MQTAVYHTNYASFFLQLLSKFQVSKVKISQLASEQCWVSEKQKSNVSTTDTWTEPGLDIPGVTWTDLSKQKQFYTS